MAKFAILKSWKRDLNPRPTDYESVALPTALFQHGSPKGTSLIIMCPLVVFKN